MRNKPKKFNRAMIYKLASEYACMPNHFSSFRFCQFYHISKNQLTYILKRAIIEGILPNHMIAFLEEKAQDTISKKDIILSKKKLQRYLKQRETFHFSKKASLYYIEDYVSSPLSLSEYAKKHYISVILLIETINRAIQKNILNESTTISLKLKNMKFSEKNTLDIN